MVQDANLDHRFVQINPDKVRGLFHCLPPLVLVTSVHDALEGWRPLYLPS